MTTSFPKSRRYFYLLIVAFCGFVTSFGAHVVNTNLPAYGNMVGVGVMTFGLVLAVYGFAELMAKPIAGFMGDRVGMRISLQGGIIAFILASLLFLFINPLYLILIRFLQGIGAAAFSTISIALVAKYFTRNRGMAYGIYNTIKGTGYGIAPIAGGFLVTTFGFDSIFIVAAAIGGAALLFSLFLPSDKETNAGTDPPKATFRQFLEPFKERKLLPVFAAIVINTFMVGALFGFLPVYLYSIGYSPVESGTIVSLVTLSYVGIQPLAGYLADRVEIHFTVTVGLMLAGMSLSIATFTSGNLLTAIVIAAGLGAGIVWTNCDTLISLLVKEEKLGAGMGAAQAFKEFGDMGGPLFIGIMSHFFGIQAGFVVVGALALFGLYLLIRSRTFEEEKSK